MVCKYKDRVMEKIGFINKKIHFIYNSQKSFQHNGDSRWQNRKKLMQQLMWWGVNVVVLAGGGKERAM